MTREEIITEIDDNVTDKTSGDKVNSAELGATMKNAVDYGKPYKEITFNLSISGGTPTPTYILNEFPDETITMTIPSTGKLRIEATNGILASGKVFVPTQVINNGGTPYFLMSDYGLLPIYLDIDLKKYDNTQSSTPSISGQRFEIRIYP